MGVVVEAIPAGGSTFVTAIGWTCVTVTGIGTVTFGIFEMALLLPPSAVISIGTGVAGIVILTTGIPAWALDVVVRAPRRPVISAT